MYNGKYIRNLKRSQLNKDSSSTTIKNNKSNKSNLQLSRPIKEENISSKNNNYTNTIDNNDITDSTKKLKVNNTNKNIFNISKTLTSFLSKTDDKGKDKSEEKQEKNLANNNISQIRRRINFRERLNNSRKKRAFFNNSINNNDNLVVNKEQEKEKIENYIQKNDKEEQNKINKENENITLNKKEFSKEKKRRKNYEIIKEKEKEREKEDIENENKEKDSINIERDIKEENLGNEIKDTVKCKICLQKMVHPKMCPKCQNISCERCLYNWFLKEQNKECNYCKEPINFYEFISVPFMDTIVDFVEKVIYDRKKYSSSFQNNTNYIKTEENNINDNSNNINEYCLYHKSEKIYYFCLNCNKGYCKTCFVFFGNEKDRHHNHKIIEYSNYKKSNFSQLKQQEEEIDYNINYINDTIKKCNSFKKLYELEQRTINDYISLIKKEYNKKIDDIIRNIDNKIFELKQSLESYYKAKKEIDEQYKKISVKNKNFSNTQYLIDKIEKMNNKKIEINGLFNKLGNINFKIYKSKNEEINIENKYINKKINFGDEIEMIIDKQLKNIFNINLNIQKTNQIKHFYKSIVYLTKKGTNEIFGYVLEDIKDGKNYCLMGNKIQLNESDFSFFEIKCVVYDFYVE